MSFGVGVVALVVGLSWPLAEEAGAATVPGGFSEIDVVSGLNAATSFDFTPDGQLFVAEKRGVVNLWEDATDPTPTVFADLRTQVHNSHDRGLLNLVVDPDFPERPFVYVLYGADAPVGGTPPTYGSPDTDSDPCGPGSCLASTRVSRLRADGDRMAEETVLLDATCTEFPIHDGGGLDFGADGALYASFGDGAWANIEYGQYSSNACGDPPGPPGEAPTPPGAEGGSLRSQDLRTNSDPAGLNGTVVRIDPNSGAALPENPRFGSEDLEERRVVAYGLRNPFRLTTRPGTSEVWVGDVGGATWEEINRVPAGSPVSNFGWPCYEGGGRLPGFDRADLAICEGLYAEPGAETTPFFAYRHRDPVVAGETCWVGPGGSRTGYPSSVISGLDFYEGGGYPSRYDGALFFADYSRRCLWAMPVGADGIPDPAATETFLTGADAVDLRTGPGGDLYYLSILEGTLRRIHFDASNAPPAPVIDATPTSGLPPLVVSLDASRSSDSDPGDTLGYAWDTDDDGAFDDATTPATEVIFALPGPHAVRLRVTDSSGVSRDTSTTVVVGSAPEATIDTPSPDTPWSVGEQVGFSGRASDLEDGELPPSAFEWSLFLHHCYTPSDCHPHHLQDLPGPSGSFVAPDHEYPARLELRLTVTDADGIEDTASVTIDPRTAELHLQTDPPGLELAVGNTVATAPFTQTVIQGSQTPLIASSPQTVDDTTYEFSQWSDGGPATHSVMAAGEATYVATFRALSRPPVANAGLDRSVAHRGRFTLDGSASNDADGDPLDYRWAQVGGPPAVIQDDQSVQTLVNVPPGPATLTFQLTVTDPTGGQHTDTMTVTIRPK